MGINTEEYSPKNGIYIIELDGRKWYIAHGRDMRWEFLHKYKYVFFPRNELGFHQKNACRDMAQQLNFTFIDSRDKSLNCFVGFDEDDLALLILMGAEPFNWLI